MAHFKYLYRSLLALVSVLALLFVFQNCGEDLGSISDQEPPSEKVTQREIIPNDLHKLKFTRFEEKVGLATYSIEIGTGNVMAEGKSEESLGCLDSKKLKKLEDILNDSEVCHISFKHSEDMLCTMEYRYPYASLVFLKNKTFDLGEKTSGCSGTTMLCDDKDGELKELVSGIKKNFPSDISDCD